MSDSSPYQQFKNIITDVFPVAHDALHVLAGLGIALVVSMLSKKPLHWKGMFLIVLAVACGAEVQDRFHDIRVYGVWQWRESIKDALLTVSPAALLALYSRCSR